MDLNELARALDEIGFEPAVLALGGRADYCWCVEQSVDGFWETYWYERGSKSNLARLESESEACFHLFGRLAYSQILAGARRTVPPGQQ